MEDVYRSDSDCIACNDCHTEHKLFKCRLVRARDRYLAQAGIGHALGDSWWRSGVSFLTVSTSPKNESNDPVDMRKDQTRSLTKRKAEGKGGNDDRKNSYKN